MAIPQDAYEYVILGRTTLEELRSIVSEALDKAFVEPTENTRRNNQRLVGLEREARQSHLASEVDVLTISKTRKRMEDTAAHQGNYGDGRFVKRVQAGPTSLTSFGIKAERPAHPCRDDVLVNNDAAAPKPCLSRVEMCTVSAVGDVLPAGKAFTATEIIFYQPPLWFCPTEQIHSETTVQYAMDYSSVWRMWVFGTKLRSNLIFNPSGSTGRLRACPLRGKRRALLCGEVFAWAPDGAQGWSIVLAEGRFGILFFETEDKRFVRVAVDRCFPRSKANKGSRQSPTARGHVRNGDNRMSGNAMARNSTERLVTSLIWSREDPLFPVHGVSTVLLNVCKTMWHYAGFKGMVF